MHKLSLVEGTPAGIVHNVLTSSEPCQAAGEQQLMVQFTKIE
jgi:hypothetical protein